MIRKRIAIFDFLTVENGAAKLRCLAVNVKKARVSPDMYRRQYQGWDIDCNKIGVAKFNSGSIKTYDFHYNITMLQDELNAVLVPELVTNGTSCADGIEDVTVKNAKAGQHALSQIVLHEFLQCRTPFVNLTGCIEDGESS